MLLAQAQSTVFLEASTYYIRRQWQAHSVQSAASLRLRRSHVYGAANQSFVDLPLNRCITYEHGIDRLTVTLSNVAHMVRNPGCGTGTAEDGLML